jgi:hypothetical protein
MALLRHQLFVYRDLDAWLNDRFNRLRRSMPFQKILS